MSPLPLSYVRRRGPTMRFQKNAGRTYAHLRIFKNITRRSGTLFFSRFRIVFFFLTKVNGVYTSIEQVSTSGLNRAGEIWVGFKIHTCLTIISVFQTQPYPIYPTLLLKKTRQ